MATCSGDWKMRVFRATILLRALAALGIEELQARFGDYYDFAGDLGGRIIRDKLWFYGGASKQAVNRGAVGVVSGPDAAGCWTCLDAPEANIVSTLTQENMKVSYQPNSSYGLLEHGNIR